MAELALPVSDRDHVQGFVGAPVTLVEYGDYECPHCTAAYPFVKVVQAEFVDDLCFAYRHFPLIQIHPYAEPAAEAAEAAGAQDRFWEMHDELFQHSPDLDYPHLSAYAELIGLDVGRFRRDLRSHHYQPRIIDDLESGLQSGVKGTPTFFINGIRHQGGYDLPSLVAAIKVALSHGTAIRH